MATHLVMGDPHCTPKANNDRFLWAGKLARDLKPDTIICMGDLSSMDSLSSYDRGKNPLRAEDIKRILTMHMTHWKNLIKVLTVNDQEKSCYLVIMKIE